MLKVQILENISKELPLFIAKIHWSILVWILKNKINIPHLCVELVKVLQYLSTSKI
jgi:hypothetical protein